MNELEITGRSRSHVVELAELGVGIHYEAVTSLLALRDRARTAGIDLRIRSGYRDFATQLIIWNGKWRGERPLLSSSGEVLDRRNIADVDMVDTILTWSALPGGSRHHWGTDIDVIDAAVVPEGYKVQLTLEEYAPNGIFGRLSGWLNENLASCGFFFPYRTFRGGFSPEPWHISYAPVAQLAVESFSLSVLRRALSESELEGKQYVLDRLPEIYTRYLINIDMPH